MNMQDMERECCERAGIEPEHLCQWNPDRKTGCTAFSTKCPAGRNYETCGKYSAIYPTGTALVEKLKAWLRKERYLYRIHGCADDAGDSIDCAICQSSTGHVWLVIGCCDDADTEHEAFIKAFHAAFCKRVIVIGELK
jgi:hypothetical protein